MLTHGTASASFPVFDVDLSADPYAGPASAKLLIPILGEPYGRELAAGRLRLVIEQDKPLVAYAGNRFPLSITSRAALDDEPEGQGDTATRTASRRSSPRSTPTRRGCTRCSRRSTTASPGGGWPATRARIAASST